MQRDRGHVLPEDDLSRIVRSHEVGQRGMGFFNQFIRHVGRPEWPVRVGIGIHQVVIHPVDGTLADLRSTGVVEVDAGHSIICDGEGGKRVTDALNIVGHDPGGSEGQPARINR